MPHSDPANLKIPLGIPVSAWCRREEATSRSAKRESGQFKRDSNAFVVMRVKSSQKGKNLSLKAKR